MRFLRKNPWISGGLGMLITLGIYLFLFLLPVGRILKNNDIQQLESRREELLAQKITLNRMEQVLEEKQEEETGILAVYNNLENEIQELNLILSRAETYQISFQEPQEEQGLIRREVWLDFTVKQYGEMRDILQQLQNGRYRCILKQAEIFAREGDVFQGGLLEGSVRATFYERVGDQTKEEHGTEGA